MEADAGLDGVFWDEVTARRFARHVTQACIGRRRRRWMCSESAAHVSYTANRRHCWSIQASCVCNCRPNGVSCSARLQTHRPSQDEGVRSQHRRPSGEHHTCPPRAPPPPTPLALPGISQGGLCVHVTWVLRWSLACPDPLPRDHTDSSSCSLHRPSATAAVQYTAPPPHHPSETRVRPVERVRRSP